LAGEQEAIIHILISFSLLIV